MNLMMTGIIPAMLLNLMACARPIADSEVSSGMNAKKACAELYPSGECPQNAVAADMTAEQKAKVEYEKCLATNDSKIAECEGRMGKSLDECNAIYCPQVAAAAKPETKPTETNNLATLCSALGNINTCTQSIANFAEKKLTAGQLLKCKDTPQKIDSCSNLGCQVNQKGTDDVCKTASGNPPPVNPTPVNPPAESSCKAFDNSCNGGAHASAVAEDKKACVVVKMNEKCNKTAENPGDRPCGCLCQGYIIGQVASLCP